MSNNGNTCGNCRYFIPVLSDNGECHVNPPTINPQILATLWESGRDRDEILPIASDWPHTYEEAIACRFFAAKEQS